MRPSRPDLLGERMTRKRLMDKIMCFYRLEIASCRSFSGEISAFENVKSVGEERR